MEDRHMIGDLRRRVKAVEAGQETGYGERYSLRVVLETNVFPFIVAWESVRLADSNEVPADVEDDLRDVRDLLERFYAIARKEGYAARYMKRVGDGEATSFRVVHPFYSRHVNVHCFDRSGLSYNRPPAAKGNTFVDYEFQEPPRKDAVQVTFLF